MVSKERQKELNKRHYENNKSDYLSRAKKQHQEYRKWFRDLKKTLKCSRCPENYWACLDFHHLYDKDESVNKLVGRMVSKNRVLEEIDKCVVLCANCHRKEHHPPERQLSKFIDLCSYDYMETWDRLED